MRPLYGGLDAWVDAGLIVERVEEEEVLIAVQRRER